MKLRIGFYSFFIIFLTVAIIHNIVMDFDWSQLVIPVILLLGCIWAIRSVKKEEKMRQAWREEHEENQ